MKTKFVVLLSGGLDSTVNLFEAFNHGEVKLIINFNYGQKAANKELSAAKKLSEYLDVKFKMIELPWFHDFGKSSLILQHVHFPKGNEIDITNIKQSLKTARSVWVPNRNGIFLNIAAGFTEAIGADAVVPGFNFEEAATFPDNSKEFMESLDKSFSFSTSNRVKVICFTDQLNKNDILKRAIDHKVPLEMMWPCYDALEQWCGVCESCLRAKRAFVSNQIEIKKYFLQ